MDKQRFAYIYAIIAIVLWSTAATAFKIALKHINFIELLFISAGTSHIVLLFILLFQKKLHLLKKTTKKDIMHSAMNGFINPFAYYIILFKAYSLLPAQVAQPVNYLWPLMLVILSAPLLKQPIRLYNIIALIISFFGVFFISTHGKITNLDIANPIGVFLALGSSVLWALFWIFNIKDKRDEIVKLFFNFMFGFIYISIVFIFTTNFNIPSYRGVLAAVYIGLFEMGITFVFWLKALQLTDTNDRISNLVYLSPFLALVFIRFVLQEQIVFTTIIGLAFIIAGILIHQLAKQKKTV